MPFRLRRHDARFGDLLNDLAGRLPAAAGLLAELLGEAPEQRERLLADLRTADQAAEVSATAVLRALASAILTPFDRVDVYRLAWALRSAVQRMAAVGEDVVQLEPERLPAVVAELVQLLAHSADVAVDAVRRVPEADLVTDAAVELNRLTHQARAAQRRLLTQGCEADAGAPALLRRVAVAASFQSAVESFEHLAHTLQTIAVGES